MAVRNGGPDLELSLRSMAAQSFRDWEMIVVDDASQDETNPMVNEWSRRDRRIRLLSNPQATGQTACLNQGLKECRAAWIARQDADDLSHPSRLEAQIRFLSDHPETVLLGTAGYLIDADGQKVGLLDVPTERAAIAWTFPFLNPFLHTSVIFHRDTALELGGYDENFRIAQDYDLWLRMTQAHPVANIPSRLVSYRCGQGSLSRSSREEAFREADTVAGRAARAAFAQEMTSEEQALVAEFRRGLISRRVGDFNRVSRRLAEEFIRCHPQFSHGPSSTRAMWALRIAGSCGGIAAVAGLTRAAAIDPVYTFRWLRERFFNA